MKLRRKHREAAEVSTESLNDIMFFLLLFFLIVSTLANPNVIKLTLPNSQHADQLQKQKITIEAKADRTFYINNTSISFNDLENALSILIDKTKEPTIILRFDNSLSVQDLADVLQIGYKLKIKMVLATKPPNG